MQKTAPIPPSDFALPRLPQKFPKVGVFSFIPGCCAACQHWPSYGLCESCYQRFKSQQLPRCLCCGIDLPSSDLQICGYCLKQPFAFDATIAAVSYVSPWQGLVQNLKFYKGTENARLMAQLMHLVIGLQPPDLAKPDLMIPIAAAHNRMRERGYNQAWEIARHLSRMRQLPTKVDILHRLHEQDSQTHRKRKERFKALKNAFSVSEKYHALLAGKHIVLVDDVMTTGATLHFAARALKKAGAARVSVWVFARTPEQRVTR